MAQFTCGNCKQTHTSVAEARACYAQPVNAHPAEQAHWTALKNEAAQHEAAQERAAYERKALLHDSRTSPFFPQNAGEPRATEKQIDYLMALAAERGTALDRSHLERSLTKKTASEAISRLLEQQPVLRAAANPVSPKEDRTLPEVPAGQYAIEMDGVLKFYRVDRPTEGKWAGRTFVKVMASDEQHPIRSFESRKAILAAIAADPRAAILRFGQEIGRCGVCGRTLTDEESRARGIGPVCAEKTGW